MLLPQVILAACCLLAGCYAADADTDSDESSRPILVVDGDIASSWAAMVDQYQHAQQGHDHDQTQHHDHAANSLLFPADLVMVMKDHSEDDVVNRLREPRDKDAEKRADEKDVLIFLEKELEIIDPDVTRNQDAQREAEERNRQSEADIRAFLEALMNPQALQPPQHPQGGMIVLEAPPSAPGRWRRDTAQDAPARQDPHPGAAAETLAPVTSHPQDVHPVGNKDNVAVVDSATHAGHDRLVGREHDPSANTTVQSQPPAEGTRGRVEAKPHPEQVDITSTTPGWVVNIPANPPIEVVTFVPVNGTRREGEEEESSTAAPVDALKFALNFEVANAGRNPNPRGNEQAKDSAVSSEGTSTAGAQQPSADADQPAVQQESKNEDNLGGNSKASPPTEPADKKAGEALKAEFSEKRGESNNEPVPVVPPLEEEPLEAVEEPPISLINFPVAIGNMEEVSDLLNMNVTFDDETAEPSKVPQQLDPADTPAETNVGTHAAVQEAPQNISKPLLPDQPPKKVAKHIKKDKPEKGDSTPKPALKETPPAKDSGDKAFAKGEEISEQTSEHSTKPVLSGEKGSAGVGQPAASVALTQTEDFPDSATVAPTARLPLHRSIQFPNNDDDILAPRNARGSASAGDQNADEGLPQYENANMEVAAEETNFPGSNCQPLETPPFDESPVGSAREVDSTSPPATTSPPDPESVSLSDEDLHFMVQEPSTTPDPTRKKKRKKKKGFKLPVFLSTTTKAPWPRSLANLAPFLPFRDITRPADEDAAASAPAQIRPPFRRRLPKHPPAPHHGPHAWDHHEHHGHHDQNEYVVPTLPPLPYNIGPPSYYYPSDDQQMNYQSGYQMNDQASYQPSYPAGYQSSNPPSYQANSYPSSYQANYQPSYQGNFQSNYQSQPGVEQVAYQPMAQANYQQAMYQEQPVNQQSMYQEQPVNQQSMYQGLPANQEVEYQGQQAMGGVHYDQNTYGMMPMFQSAMYESPSNHVNLRKRRRRSLGAGTSSESLGETSDVVDATVSENVMVPSAEESETNNADVTSATKDDEPGKEPPVGEVKEASHEAPVPLEETVENSPENPLPEDQILHESSHPETVALSLDATSTATSEKPADTVEVGQSTGPPTSDQAAAPLEADPTSRLKEDELLEISAQKSSAVEKDALESAPPALLTAESADKGDGHPAPQAALEKASIPEQANQAAPATAEAVSPSSPPIIDLSEIQPEAAVPEATLAVAPRHRRLHHPHLLLHPGLAGMDVESPELARPVRQHTASHNPPPLPPAMEDLIPRAGETEAEKAEREQKAVQRMIQVVNVLGSLQSFLSDRARTLVRRLSKIVEEEEGEKLS